MTVNDAIIKMRTLTELGIPFSFEFYSYNSTKDISYGLKKVDQALLRLGLRQDQSDKSEVLIAYTNHISNTPKFFYLPLLMKLNGISITQ
jgi:hypothetical protein